MIDDWTDLADPETPPTPARLAELLAGRNRMAAIERLKQERLNTWESDKDRRKAIKKHYRQLTVRQQAEVRTRVTDGESQTDLALEFGVPISAIHRASRGSRQRKGMAARLA